MAVNADWTRVAEHEALHSDEAEWAMTQSLCALGWGYGLLHYLGVSGITQDNIGEVCARYAVLQGMRIVTWNGAAEIAKTDKWLVRRIGISTNYPTLTRTQWLTKIVKPIMDMIADEHKAVAV